jgi:integrase
VQRGSLKKFFDTRKRVWVWRFQWREKGSKGPRTRVLGRCSQVSRADARALADAILERVQGVASKSRPSTLSLRRFVEDEYLEVRTRKWKASTRGTTEQLIEDHILAPLGDQLLHSIDRRELQTLLDHLAAGGKSGSIVKHVRWQLSAIFKMAVGDGLLSVNPTGGLQNPRCKPEGEKVFLTPEHFQRAQMCLEIRERLILRLGAVEGLGPGEITALQCGDISADGLRIERRIYRRAVDTPKSKRGTRLVPMSDATRKVLDEYLKILPDTSPGAWLCQ